MQRLFAAVVACLMLAACNTTATQVHNKGGARPEPGARILLVQPDVELSMLTAAGLNEPKAEWSAAAVENLTRTIGESMDGRSHTFKTLDPDVVSSGRLNQLLRLHDTVGGSIAFFGQVLQTKKGGFDWTLGEGARALGEAYDADYALFVTARGNYSSGGRVAVMLVAAAAGVSVPTGGQAAIVSLVDLRTGRIVWFNQAVAGPDADMRDPRGAEILTRSLLKDIPL